MKILFVTEQYTPTVGGAVVAAQQLIRGLVERGHTVSVATISPHIFWYAGGRKDETGATVYRALSLPSPVNPKINYMTIFPVITVPWAIWREKPDCIHMMTPFCFSHLIALWLARLLKIPIVTTNHIMPENAIMTIRLKPLLRFTPFFTRLAWRNIMLCARVADYVTAPTPTALKMLYEHGLCRPAAAISNGINSDYYVPSTPDMSLLHHLRLAHKKGPRLIYVGRLDDEKRIDLIVAAMPAIVRQYPLAELVIVGTGVCAPALKRQAKRLNIRRHIIFTGRVTDDEKRALLQSSDLFVIASPAELQCIAGLEALSCGLPIVAANIAALIEMCQDGVTGYTFRYPDATDLAYQVVRLLGAPDRPQFGQNSRRWIEAFHTMDAVIGQYQTIYHQAANSRVTAKPSMADM